MTNTISYRRFVNAEVPLKRRKQRQTPMLRNITGPHIHTLTDDSKRLLTTGRASSLKVLDAAFSVDLITAWANNNPGCPIALRQVDNGATLDNVRERTKHAGDKFSPLLNRVSADVHLESTINEKFVAGDELRRHADVMVEVAGDCIAAGYIPICFNIPVGNIARIAGANVNGTLYTTVTSEMNLIRDAVKEINKLNGVLGYHNYTIPGKPLDTWYDLRHERMAAELPTDTQWWLGEGMYDYGIINNQLLRGWRYEPFHQSAEDVSRYFRRLAQHLAADTRVVAQTPFGAGTPNDWSTFQYDNESVICQIFGEKYAVDDSPIIGAGFRRMIPYLGAPLENEVYHFAGTPMEMSAAVFEKGVAQWFKATNETVGQDSNGAIYTDKGNAGDGTTVWKVYPLP